MKRLGHVPALDGIRGIAVAIVVLGHLFGIPKGAPVGVDLFFALSGFLITTLLLEERRETGTINLKAFYARRSRRLFPALAVLLLAYLLWEAAAGHNALGTVALGGLYFSNFVQAFTRPNVLIGSGLDHLWSLAEEEQFYLLWPILLIGLCRFRGRRLALWVGVLAVAMLAYRTGLLLSGARVTRVYRAPDTNGLGLMLGALLAVVRIDRRIRVPEWAGLAAISIVLVSSITLFWTVGWWLVGQPILELACVVVVAASVGGGGLAVLLAARPLVGLGRISYSLYLWHMPIFWAAGYRHAAIVLPVSLVAAWISYRYVEQPFRRRRAAAPLAEGGDANVVDEGQPRARVRRGRLRPA